jgi:lysophospholipase L1-like esterase
MAHSVRMTFKSIATLIFATTIAIGSRADTADSSPALLAVYKPLPAPLPSHLLLKKHDRLAICGDSITEQKMYSRIIEDYLTACVPQLDVTARQFGWGGERAPAFLARMTNDCLRFHPTIATTCYGMNDFAYQPYQEWLGLRYQTNTVAIVQSFKAHGVRVILGSPGCVGKIPPWALARAAMDTNETVQNLELSLCTLRNIDVEIARQEKVGFPDVFWPMLNAGANARAEYGANYRLSGPDGVHPNWAGHLVMAYAFLKAMGLNGDIGTFTVNLTKNKIKVSAGNEVVSAANGVFVIKSSRYPFCACEPAALRAAGYPVSESDDVTSDNSIRSGMSLVPFNQELNRLILVAKNGIAENYKVTWGDQSRTFSAAQLAAGINLAVEFPENPFSEAFARVDAAVAIKQAFETEQIKKIFRSPAAKADMESVAATSEQTRQPLADAIKTAFVPVTHTITITAE